MKFRRSNEHKVIYEQFPMIKLFIYYDFLLFCQWFFFEISETKNQNNFEKKTPFVFCIVNFFFFCSFITFRDREIKLLFVFYFCYWCCCYSSFVRLVDSKINTSILSEYSRLTETKRKRFYAMPITITDVLRCSKYMYVARSEKLYCIHIQ